MEKPNKKKALNVKAVVFDGDGVIFPSQTNIRVGENGNYEVMFQRRSHVDGQGISLLRAAGIRIAFITAESDGFIGAVTLKLNALESVKKGMWPLVDSFTGPIGKDKVKAIGDWLSHLGFSWEECAYMGDDIGDWEIMKKVGLPTAPAKAEKIIKEIALFIAEREGGNGAVRDLCDFILNAKEIDPRTLSLR